MPKTLDLLPAAVDVDYYQSDGRTITLDFGALDLTNPARTWLAQVRKAPRSSELLGSFTVTLDGTSKAVLVVDDGIAALVGEYAWDVEWQIGAARPLTLVAGKWRGWGDVSRP